MSDDGRSLSLISTSFVAPSSDAEPAPPGHRALREARRALERWIASFTLLICLLGLLFSLWRARFIDAASSASIQLVLATMGLYYAYIFVRARKTSSGQLARWVQVTLEVSAISVIIEVDARISTSFGLTSPTQFVYPLVVAVSGLRLEPRLSLYAGTLAAAQAIGLYYWWRATDHPPALMSLSEPFLWYRVATFFLVGVVGATVATTLRQLLTRSVAEAERRYRIRQAFGTYVDEQVVERLLSGDLSPRTERREVSVLFVDIRGFTALSENTPPAVLLERLNLALEAFSQSVKRSGGVVDKYLGDGLMAIFGAPQMVDDHADRAVRAARRCVTAAARLRATGAFPELRIGVAVHTGEAVVGDVGGRAQREYTAIGDVVNVAARLEQANKRLGTTILITQATRSQLSRAPLMRPHPPQELRNRRAPVEVFEVLQ